MDRALVLNLAFEPISVVSVRRALLLVLKRKAEVIVEGPSLLRSATMTIAAPSVIRLQYFVRVPYRARASLSRRAVFVRDGHLCQYCGATAENLDHVIPRSRGGLHVWENVVAACRRCNAGKEDRLLHEVGLRLRHEPQVPRDSLWVRVAVGHVEPQWEPYLRNDRTPARP